jgi:hypothetical protein
VRASPARSGLIKQAQIKSGLALVDEAMLAVTAGELSPIKHLKLTGRQLLPMHRHCMTLKRIETSEIAFEASQQVQAPYAAACVRTRMGLACRSLGDEETARLEFGAARAAKVRLIVVLR